MKPPISSSWDPREKPLHLHVTLLNNFKIKTIYKKTPTFSSLSLPVTLSYYISLFFSRSKMCTVEKRGNCFILTLAGDGDHRLNPPLINSIISAIYQVKAQSSPNSVLITTSHPNSFSPGFDLPWALAAGSLPAAIDRLNHMIDIFKTLVAELLSLRMPTIAALPGDAAAAGFLLALSHDYIIMRSDLGELYMREIDLGLTLPDYFSAMFKSKIGSSSVRRDILLKGMKVRGEEAVKMGVVESVHDGVDGVMEAAVKLGEELAARNWNGEVYAEMRKSLFPEISGVLELPSKVITISKLAMN